jgi:alpha-glucosidase (family GH31 glycosyl hydrolase)
VEDSYMAGEALHVSTILEANATSFSSKFPMGNWVSLSGDMDEVLSVGENQNIQNLTASDGGALVHLKEGKAIPYQPEIYKVASTMDLQTTQKTQFVAFRDSNGYADGHFLLDDGISADSYSSNNFAYWKFRLASNTITFWIEEGDSQYNPPKTQKSHYVENFKILQAADLAETDFACLIGQDMAVTQILPDYNSGTQTLELRANDNVNIRLQDVNMIRFGNSQNEVNWCNMTTSFKYNVMKQETQNDGRTLIATLANNDEATNMVYANFTAIDNSGSVKVTLSQTMTPDLSYASGLSNEGNLNITDKVDINDLVKITTTPFSYTIMDKNMNQVYQGDQLMYFNETANFIMTQSHIKTNIANGVPIFGLGQRGGSLNLPKNKIGVYTMWNSAMNTDGYQPFYMFQSSDKMFAGVYDQSTYASDYVLDNDRFDGEAVFTHILTGGSVEKFIFISEMPDAVVATYQKLVGFPSVPPEWAFGWAHSQDGLINGTKWEEIATAYQAASMPLDSLWAAIDYTDDFKTFTVSDSKYKDLGKMVDSLHKMNVNFVPVIESGISMEDGTNPAYTDGMTSDVFIKSMDGKPAVGQQYGNDVVYPDFTNAATSTWWSAQMTTFHTAQAFDGIWLQDNQMMSECDGFCAPYNMKGVQVPAMDVENKLIYVPGNERLDAMSLDVNAMYSNGMKEFDLHNKFAFMQSEATADFFTNVMKSRPMVMSQSSISGMGKVASTYSGENLSTNLSMEQSVNDLYLANTYGMPFHGSDVCGYMGDTTPTLCARWYMLAATQPFARNANYLNQMDQAPYTFTGLVPGLTKTTYSQLIQSYMTLKYNYLRYAVSYFHGIHTQGGAYYKPLFYLYPNDADAYQNMTSNILLGDSLKFSFNSTAVDFSDAKAMDTFYFPEGSWCQVHPVPTTYACFEATSDVSTRKRQYASTIDSAYIHMKQGAIVPFQEASNEVINTSSLNKLATSYYMIPNSSDNTPSVGYVAFDADGTGKALEDQVRTYELTLEKAVVDKKYTELRIDIKMISGPTPGDKYVDAASPSENWGTMTIMDAKSIYESVKFNFAEFYYIKEDGTEDLTTEAVTYDEATQTLTVPAPQLNDTDKNLNIAFIKYIKLIKAIV